MSQNKAALGSLIKFVAGSKTEFPGLAGLHCLVVAAVEPGLQEL